MQSAQKMNENRSKHFPIMGVGYGMLSMVKSQLFEHETLESFRA